MTCKWFPYGLYLVSSVTLFVNRNFNFILTLKNGALNKMDS